MRDIPCYHYIAPHLHSLQVISLQSGRVCDWQLDVLLTYHSNM